MLVRLTVTVRNRQIFMDGETEEWVSTLRGWVIDVPSTHSTIINRILRAYWKDRLLDWSIILHN